jgi:hypothetical protein
MPLSDEFEKNFSGPLREPLKALPEYAKWRACMCTALNCICTGPTANSICSFCQSGKHKYTHVEP